MSFENSKRRAASKYKRKEMLEGEETAMSDAKQDDGEMVKQGLIREHSLLGEVSLYGWSAVLQILNSTASLHKNNNVCSNPVLLNWRPGTDPINILHRKLYATVLF